MEYHIETELNGRVFNHGIVSTEKIDADEKKVRIICDFVMVEDPQKVADELTEIAKKYSI